MRVPADGSPPTLEKSQSADGNVLPYHPGVRDVFPFYTTSTETPDLSPEPQPLEHHPAVESIFPFMDESVTPPGVLVEVNQVAHGFDQPRPPEDSVVVAQQQVVRDQREFATAKSPIVIDRQRLDAKVAEFPSSQQAQTQESRETAVKVKPFAAQVKGGISKIRDGVGSRVSGLKERVTSRRSPSSSVPGAPTPKRSKGRQGHAFIKNRERRNGRQRSRRR